MSDDVLRSYLDEIDRYPELRDDEELQLLREIKEGHGDTDALRKRLIQANLRLVAFIARFFEESPVPMLDLIQEGNVGLLRAIDAFDPGTGLVFKAHATRSIRQAISRGIADRGMDKPD